MNSDEISMLHHHFPSKKHVWWAFPRQSGPPKSAAEAPPTTPLDRCSSMIWRNCDPVGSMEFQRDFTLVQRDFMGMHQDFIYPLHPSTTKCLRFFLPGDKFQGSRNFGHWKAYHFRTRIATCIYNTVRIVTALVKSFHTWCAKRRSAVFFFV